MKLSDEEIIEYIEDAVCLGCPLHRDPARDCSHYDCYIAMEAFKERLSEVNSVEIVHCGDCEHFQYVSEGCGGCSRFEEEQIMTPVSWNDYCSFGEKAHGEKVMFNPYEKNGGD